MINKSSAAHSFALIAIGYIFLNFDFNLGTLDILADWICYALILSALPAIAQIEPSARLLRSFCIFLCVWSGFIWIQTIHPFFDMNRLALFQAGAIIISVYFHFQLLTNTAEAARKCGCCESDINRLLKLRTAQTIINTLSFFVSFSGLISSIGEDIIYGFTIIAASLAVLVMIFMEIILFRLYKQLKNDAQAENQEAS